MSNRETVWLCDNVGPSIINRSARPANLLQTMMRHGKQRFTCKAKHNGKHNRNFNSHCKDLSTVENLPDYQALNA